MPKEPTSLVFHKDIFYCFLPIHAYNHSLVQHLTLGTVDSFLQQSECNGDIPNWLKYCSKVTFDCSVINGTSLSKTIPHRKSQKKKQTECMSHGI